jgi:PKD repeat protein
VNGTEKVFYKSLDQYGCSSGQRDYITVQTNNPTAEISSSEQKINFGKSVQFFASQSKNAESFEWDFGEGGRSLERSPWHYYYESGSFDITLTLTSSNGCVTVLKRGEFIEVLPEPGRGDIILGANGNFSGEYEEKVISAYPIPHGKELNLEFISAHDVNADVVAINMMGITVKLDKVFIREGRNRVTVNTTELPSGAYQVRILSPTHTFNFKTIKQ